MALDCTWSVGDRSSLFILLLADDERQQPLGPRHLLGVGGRRVLDHRRLVVLRRRVIAVTQQFQVEALQHLTKVLADWTLDRRLGVLEGLLCECQ